MNNIDKQIEQRVAGFVNELTALVRQAALEAVSSALGGKSTRAVQGPAPTAKKAERPAARSGKRGRRSADQIAAIVGTVLGYIKSHPDSRSEAIRKALKLPRPVMRDALDRLGTGKKIKMKGVKRAATYTAA